MGTTDNYRQGAVGFWIENGKFTYPTTEVTIAGNLKEIFMGLTPANNLVMRGSINASTYRIERMAIAGI